jgi:hypothetical protein
VPRSNLRVNIPKSDRELFVGEELAVYWLAMPDNMLPAKKEYEEEVDDTKVQATLAVIDQLALNNEPVPSTRIEKITHKRVSLWEVNLNISRRFGRSSQKSSETLAELRGCSHPLDRADHQMVQAVSTIRAGQRFSAHGS